MDSKCVLAILPHPDDMEIFCGGALIRLVSAGHEVHVATMTPGDKGSAELSRSEIAAIRRKEAQAGAQVIGTASYACLEFSDLEIVFDNPARRVVTEFVRKINPFLVITTPPNDYMMDHIIASHLIRDACFNAGAKNYDVPGEPMAAMPYLYYVDAVLRTDMFGAETSASTTIDISRQIDRKCAALACHASQRSWLARQGGIPDYVQTMRDYSARCARNIGVAYAEKFVQHRGHPHPQDDVLPHLV